MFFVFVCFLISNIKIFSFIDVLIKLFYILLQRGIYCLCNEMNHRLFHLFLRACWPSCPSASTGWTCTTALPTSERWQERRRAQRGRTFSTSSMNYWVSGARVINHMKYPHLLSAVDPGQKYSINLPSVSSPNPPPLLHTSHFFSHLFSFLSPP